MLEEPYNRRFFLYILLLILVLLLWLMVSTTIFAQKPAREPLKRELEGIYLGFNTLISISPTYLPYVYTNGDLIECLIMKESSGNHNAINPCDIDGLPKFGCLQFGKITWQEKCVEEYGLLDDIMDCSLQIECADRLITDGQLWRWGTKDNCI